MTTRPLTVTGRRHRSPRVGLFGYLGAGNIGNEGSLEVVLAYLRSDQPDAIVDAMSTGPERVRACFGIEATPLLFSERYEHRVTGATAIALKVAGKALDTIRIASWVRRHDAVIVPGAGALETTLPTRAWQLPYSLFLLCAFGRLFGTKVALVNVGANLINQRSTRWLLNTAARLAYYRSYRDLLSRDAMLQRGLDTTHDRVYPDLVFGMHVPALRESDAQTVGLGLMAYYGSNDDRQYADVIHDVYLDKMKLFLRWLVDNGRRVRLFGGDSTFDDSVITEVLADLRAHRPELEEGVVVAEHISSLAGLMTEMSLVNTVVASRYHNVVCALRLSKPTISIGYSQKHDVLMADMGMAEFCQSLSSLDLERLIAQFTEVEQRSLELSRIMAERNAAKAHELDQQFALLSSLLFPAPTP